MAAYKTQQELVVEALAELGVLAAGQPIDPEDFNFVNVKVQSTFDKIEALEIVSVGDPDNIPGEWFADLAKILAGECAGKFGQTTDDYVRLVNAGLGGVQGVDVGYGAAAKSLRQMNRSRPTGEVLRTQYF